MRVIYIAGAAHSGSTLLDMMLNAHPEIISVGEIFKLNSLKYRESGELKRRHCSCGAGELLQCPFWSRVNDRVKQTYGRPLVDINIEDYGRHEAASEANTVLFKAISEVSDKKFIVDSSKMPRRLAHLLRLKQLNVHPIHLIRSPEGQITSVIDRFGIVKSILRYEIVNAQTRQTLKSVPHSVVRYEDLVLHPERTLQSLLQPLGLDFHPLQLAWAEQPKHSFAGNHARWQIKSELVLDESWKRRLSRFQRLLIEFGTFLSRSNAPRPVAQKPGT